MKTKTLGWIVCLGALASGFTSCSQAKVDCQVALAGSAVGYLATFTVKGATPACAMTPGLVKSNILTDVDTIGLEYFHPPTADGMTYDTTKSTFAIQSDSLGGLIGFYEGAGSGDACESIARCHSDNLADTTTGDAYCKMNDPDSKCVDDFCVPTACTAADHRYGFGDFTSTTPGTDDFCPVTGIKPATVDLAEVIDTAGAGVPVDGTAACTLDADCQVLGDPTDPTSGDPASGAVCEAGFCMAGCRANDVADPTMPATNGCVDPYLCTSTDNARGDCKVPHDKITYEWSNLQVYVTASAQGTQFSADLRYTENTDATGDTDCVVDYHVVGMWPAVTCEQQVCEIPDPDPMKPGKPCTPGSDCSTCVCSGNGMPDPLFCSPCSDPLNKDCSKVRVLGSGINPNFPTKCIPAFGTFVCALDTSKGETIPQLTETAPDCGPIQ